MATRRSSSRHRDEVKQGPALWKRWLIAAPAIAGALYVMWVAICFGASNFNALEAEYTINSRVNKQLPPDVLTLNKARGALEKAVSWNPANSTAHENLALVHRIRLSLPNLTMVDRQEALDLALAHILTAASLRPTNGYTYSLVAQIKFFRGERDAVFHKALTLAVKYGPYEPGTQTNVIDIGSRAWDILSPSERDDVRNTIKRALETRPEEMKRFLLTRRWVLPNCAELQVKIPDLCK